MPAGKRFIADHLSIRGDCAYQDTTPDPWYLVSLHSQHSMRADPALVITKRYDGGLLFRYDGPAGFWADPGWVKWQVHSFARSCLWDLILSGHYEPLS